MHTDLFAPTFEERNREYDVDYKIIQTESDFAAIIQQIENSRRLSLDLETTGLGPSRDKIVGVSISLLPCTGFYIPIAHRTGEPQLPELLVIENLKPVFQNPHKTLSLHNGKFDLQFFSQYGITSFKCQLFDSMIAALLLNYPKSGLKFLSENVLKKKQIKYAEITDDAAITMDEVDIQTAGFYACMDSDFTLQLGERFQKEISKRGIDTLFSVEMEVLKTLLAMEREGVKIDSEYLKQIEPAYLERIENLQKEIWKQIGSFNVNSNQQLADKLFGQMGFPVIRTTKEGRSVDSGVLEELKKRTAHPVFDLLLRYRSEEKLYSTYVKGLRRDSDDNGRVHTSFWQAVSTGRLSSSAPNLQNIPDETRRAIVASKGNVIVSCDYSQIELRVMAYMSKDRVLTESFQKEEDVHARTASEIYGCKIENVTPEMRKAAKTMNFALIYGSTEWGIAAGIQKSVEEAREFMSLYFRRYSGVWDFMEKMREIVRKKGYVETLLGRRIMIPDIRSVEQKKRERAERVAINSPIQGSAADIIKIAMARVFLTLSEINAIMILQVHDELLFEVPQGECTQAVKRIKAIMERSPTPDFDIPLLVDAEVGPSYGELHPFKFSK
jgi:DNA polymerase I